MTTSQEFREFGKAMIDYVADYLDNIADRRVVADVKPGYLRPLLPAEAPEEPEPWQQVMKDLEPIIMKGVTHWHSPHFHAYFPTANSYPSLVADILSGGIGCIGFSWIASPACTELEMVMMDWLGKMLQLPDSFLFSPAGSGPEDSPKPDNMTHRTTGKGGGVIQGTASEATLVALLSARAKVAKLHMGTHPSGGEPDQEAVLHKLVGYASKLAHSSVERAGLLGGIKMRLLDPDEVEGSLMGDVLERAMDEDEANGLIPFFVVATLGTTPCCSFDNLEQLGHVCQRRKIWLHVDAAYAGSAFICPEYRPLLNGIEMADSFNFNPHKWLLVNFDCSAMWVKDTSSLVDAFNVDPLYLRHSHQGEVPDYRHWHIPLGRRFRSLKIWFALRMYGQKGLREHIRQQIKLAHEFECKVAEDDRFELTHPVTLGLVCFRLKGPNQPNELLNKAINDGGAIHLTPSKIGQTYFIRFAVCSRFTKSSDIDFAWEAITACAAKVLAGKNN